MMVSPRHFLSLADVSAKELSRLLDRSIEMKQMQAQGVPHPYLAGKCLAMVFEQASTRTRLGFEVGMFQLGGHAVFLSSQDTHLSRNEPIEHTAKVLSGMVDVVMVRTHSHDNLLAFTQAASVPVINGMTATDHPCQLLADMQAFREIRGDIKGAKVAFLGDGHNMCNSYMEAAALLEFDLHIACPKGYEPDAARLAKASSHVTLTQNPKEAVAGAALVTTDVWASLAHDGEVASVVAERAERLRAFKNYQVTPKLMQLSDAALFMHCLPAHVGEEIDENMLDHSSSVVWQEASNRLHSQKALLEFLLAP